MRLEAKKQTFERPYTGLEIAVVGMACRVPGATSVGEFWQMLRDGREGIRDLSREELLAQGVNEAVVDSHGYVKRKGVVPDADLFDAPFFGMNPREALITDPQHRVFLELVWQAMDDAGAWRHLPEEACGVYAGTGASSYLWRYALQEAEREGYGLSEVIIGNTSDHLATRVAYKLNLTGPAITLQTSCSTSLVAVHYACQALIAGECSLAIAGGVSIATPLLAGYRYQAGGIASPDGYCRPFDGDAAGTVSGSGAGVVVLKRLSDALASGDRIRAVIRGSAVNNDGSNKVGYAAPSVQGQAAVIAGALATSGLHQSDIGYIEAHGTATPLGDPIEIAALREAICAGVDPEVRCMVGAVKSNVGHLDAAAGVVGLIKTVLVLEHGEIPPTLHYRKSAPALGLEGTRLKVCSELTTWQPHGPRRAGVSSFGIGGTNAHVILEQAPPPTTCPVARDGQQIICLSARNPADLQLAKRQLADHLLTVEDVQLSDVAYTLHVGRKEFSHRWAAVSSTRQEAIEALLTRSETVEVAQPTPRVALLFPGQGAEHAGMGKALYHADSMFRTELDASMGAFGSLRSRLHIAILGEEGSHTLLADTLLAQAAMFCVQYSVARVVTRLGVVPVAMLGHSLGEVVAAAVADTFTLEQAATLIHARGTAMSNTAHGAMVAVMAPAAIVAGWLPADMYVSADNADEQCVVAMPHASLEAAVRLFTQRGIPHSAISTRYAFHSPFMDVAARKLSQVIVGMSLKRPNFPVLSNVSGTWLDENEATTPVYWGRQVRASVRFREALDRLAEIQPTMLVEIGPGETLSRLAKKHPALRSLPACSMLAGSRDAASVHDSAGRALAALWTHGVRLNWTERLSGATVASLPSYPFARKRYWIDAGQSPVAGQSPSAPSEFVADKDHLSHASVSQLPRRHHRPSIGTPFVPAATPIEATLAQLFANLLKIDRVGVEDSFFDLGGDSLQGVRLVDSISRALDAALSVATIYSHPTPRRLANVIAGHRTGTTASPIG